MHMFCGILQGRGQWLVTFWQHYANDLNNENTHTTYKITHRIEVNRITVGSLNRASLA